MEHFTDKICPYSWESILLNDDETPFFLRVSQTLRDILNLRNKVAKLVIAFQPYFSNLMKPLSMHVKYLGVHLDTKLNWRTHIEKKREEVELRFRSLY